MKHQSAPHVRTAGSLLVVLGFASFTGCKIAMVKVQTDMGVVDETYKDQSKPVGPVVTTAFADGNNLVLTGAMLQQCRTNTYEVYDVREHLVPAPHRLPWMIPTAIGLTAGSAALIIWSQMPASPNPLVPPPEYPGFFGGILAFPAFIFDATLFRTAIRSGGGEHSQRAELVTHGRWDDCDPEPFTGRAAAEVGGLTGEAHVSLMLTFDDASRAVAPGMNVPKQYWLHPAWSFQLTDTNAKAKVSAGPEVTLPVSGDVAGVLARISAQEAESARKAAEVQKANALLAQRRSEGWALFNAMKKRGVTTKELTSILNEYGDIAEIADACVTAGDEAAQALAKAISVSNPTYSTSEQHCYGKTYDEADTIDRVRGLLTDDKYVINEHKGATVECARYLRLRGTVLNGSSQDVHVAIKFGYRANPGPGDVGGGVYHETQELDVSAHKRVPYTHDLDSQITSMGGFYSANMEIVGVWVEEASTQVGGHTVRVR